MKLRHQARASILKAMAHPTRLFIIDELSRRDCCVNELTTMIGADMSTVSKHLSVLKQAGIVDDRKEGTTIHYSLRCSCILSFIDCIEEIMTTNAKKQNDILKCCGIKR